MFLELEMDKQDKSDQSNVYKRRSKVWQIVFQQTYNRLSLTIDQHLTSNVCVGFLEVKNQVGNCCLKRTGFKIRKHGICDVLEDDVQQRS